MAYLNKCMLIGNIGKDPQISMTPSGKKRVGFSLATSKRYRDANGEQKEQTEWHNIVGWGKIADTMETLGVHKGMTLYVEGSLTNRSWTDNQGQKRTMTEVNMSTFQLLGPRNNGAPQGQQGSVYGQAVANDYQQGMAQQQQAYASGEDDDLPF